MNLKHQPLWLLAGIAVCMTAQASQPQPQQDQTAPRTVDSTSAGSKIAIDPKTGKLRAPTDEESLELSQAAAPAAAARSLRRGEPLAAGKRGFVAPTTAGEASAGAVSLPAGGVMQQVPESFMTNVAITRNAQGQLVMQHVDEDAVPKQANQGADNE